MKPPTSKEWGCCAEVSFMELNVVRPLLPSAYPPRLPPTVVVQYRSSLVVLPDLHTYYAAFRANWESYEHTQCRIMYIVNILLNYICVSSDASRGSVLVLLDLGAELTCTKLTEILLCVNLYSWPSRWKVLVDLPKFHPQASFIYHLHAPSGSDYGILSGLLW